MGIVTVITGPTIAAGESLSDVLDISSPNTGLTKVIFPNDWTFAPELNLHSISFQWSADGVEFFDVCDSTGTELLAKVVPNSICILSRDVARSGFLKFRSGPSRYAVKQAAVRTFRCILE